MSAPNSVTMNGTRCYIRPLMKCTSRLSRSSLETTIGHLAFRAALIAAANCGRRSSASAPLPSAEQKHLDRPEAMDHSIYSKSSSN